MWVTVQQNITWQQSLRGTDRPAFSDSLTWPARTASAAVVSGVDELTGASISARRGQAHVVRRRQAKLVHEAWAAIADTLEPVVAGSHSARAAIFAGAVETRVVVLTSWSQVFLRTPWKIKHKGERDRERWNTESAPVYAQTLKEECKSDVVI